MALRINDTVPDFKANTTHGSIDFHNWIGDGWAMLFSHPKDFTPVCATELAYVAKLHGEFEKRDCKVIGLSVDTVEDHQRWSADIEELAGTKLNYPLIADDSLSIAKLFDMLPATDGDSSEGRTAADNQTVRSVFLVGPDKKVKMSLTYPMASGRNFDELLRVLDSCQLTSKHKVATPANWGKGEDVIILPSINNDDAKALFPDGWETVKPYLRKVKDPSK
jgi:alkyl hydroperoxide reductase subunit AhpC